MAQKILNAEFRDAAALASYPFSSDATFTAGAVAVDIGCFLDAILYPVQLHEAPYYISELSGLYSDPDSLELTVKDDNNTEVCRIACSILSDTAMAADSLGRIVGAIVYDPDLMASLLGKVGKRRITAGKAALPFSCGTCFSGKASGTLNWQAGDLAHTGDITLAAVNGFHFEYVTPEPYIDSSSRSSSESLPPFTSTSTSHSSSSDSSPSSSSSSTPSSQSSSSSSQSVITSSSSDSSNRSSVSSASSSSISSSSSSRSSSSSFSSSSSSSGLLTQGTISISMYGEMDSLNMPIRTVNGVAYDHLWLAAHPDSAVRIQTDPDNKLIIGKAKDFGTSK